MSASAFPVDDTLPPPRHTVPDAPDGLLRDDILRFDLPDTRLEAMRTAAEEIRQCQEVLAKSGDTVLSELLRPDSQPQLWRHYPQGDIFDGETHAQYFFHAHAPTERSVAEYGHIHCFLRPFGMPPGVRPWPGQRPPAEANDALCHLVGISLDAHSVPFRLFTTNRWVTGETWYPADDVIAMLDRFTIGHARPSWPANRWVSALTRLFRPQIEALLYTRDALILARRHAGGNPAELDQQTFEDRTLELMSQVPITLEAQEHALRAALRNRPTPDSSPP